MNDRPETECEYDERLGFHLLKLLSEGPQPLASLISRAQGAYPTDVLATLRALERIEKTRELAKDIWVPAESTAQAVTTPLLPIDSQTEDESGLPEPHPLDFDWRFARRTLARLEEKLPAAPSTRIAVLGAPTLFRYLREHHRRARLFDRNEQVISFLRGAGYSDITQCDLFSYTAEYQSDCVIADPPWYLGDYRAFIRASTQMLLPGGTLLLSVLPLLTRPSAQSDRATIVKFARERGFDQVKEDSAFLDYLSPPFELEALRSEGLHVANWRSGDLFTFVLSERKVSACKPEESQDDYCWRTFVLGRSVIKVKWDGSRFPCDFAFETVSETNDIRLRSVSRRSPSRSKINLWTSRNIALRVTRVDLACAALQLLTEGHNPEDAVSVIAQAEHLGAVGVDRLLHLLDMLINDVRI